MAEGIRKESENICKQFPSFDSLILSAFSNLLFHLFFNAAVLPPLEGHWRATSAAGKEGRLQREAQKDHKPPTNGERNFHSRAIKL